MWRYVLTREEDLPDGTVNWRLSPEEDNSGWFYGPLVDWDMGELNRIAATMHVGERKILKI